MLQETILPLYEIKDIIYNAINKLQLTECPRCHVSLNINDYVGYEDIENFINNYLFDNINHIRKYSEATQNNLVKGNYGELTDQGWK